MTSNKRSRSAARAEPELPQTDGACFGKPDQPEPEPEKAEAPKMPAFLLLEKYVIRSKYDELVALENERLIAAACGADEWRKPPPDPVLDRYSNILPWDSNRIKLHVPDGVNDYINASPVTLVSTSQKQSDIKSSIQDKYICMQGPKEQTIDHVWHMVWHEIATPYNSVPAIILMLSPTHGPSPGDPSRLMEKCYPYYPLDEKSPPLRVNEKNALGEDFKATVRFVSREPPVPGTAIEVRKFIMTVDGEDEEKPIYHYLYPHWPDFGALDEKNVGSILALMDLSRKQNGKGENPRVVHCSAGVGRTGTFVALEFLSGELQGGAWDGWDENGTPGSDPIFETVNQLRMQRKTMVQAYEQYEFLYEVLRKMWEEKYRTPCTGGEHQHASPPDATSDSEPPPAKVVKA